MKPLIGLLLILSGLILAIPQLYEVLSYLDMNRWPVIQGILGIGCITVGVFYLIWKGKSGKKTLVEIG
jgi:hypothetical protein